MVVAAGCGRLDFNAIGRGGPGDARTDGASALGDGALVDSISSGALCAESGVFCDGFESGDLSKWSGTAISTNCTVAASKMYAHTGSYGLLGDTSGASSVADFAEAYVTFTPRTTGMLAVRIWADAISVIDQNAGVLELGAGVGDFSHALVIAATDERVWQVSELYGDAQGDHPSTVSTAQATWMCFELDYTFGAPSQVAFYIDDVDAVTFAANDDAPTFSSLYVGAQRATDSGAVMAIDDVVVASQHIGCD